MVELTTCPVCGAARRVASKHAAKALRATRCHCPPVDRELPWGTERQCTSCREWWLLDQYGYWGMGGRTRACLACLRERKNLARRLKRKTPSC